MRVKYVFTYIFYFLSLFYVSGNIPEFITIQGDNFVMGDKSIIIKNIIDENPKASIFIEHEVNLDSIKVSKYEISFHDFSAFTRENHVLPERYEFIGADKFNNLIDKYTDFPITKVNYFEALEYCHWLTIKTGKIHRLPTEAEWEFIATNGKGDKYPWGKDYVNIIPLEDYNPYTFEMNFKEHVYEANSKNIDITESGVCKLYGNVKEYVLDDYSSDFYKKSPFSNPLNIIGGRYIQAVSRGRAGYVYPKDLYGVKYRDKESKGLASDILGFRIIQEIEPTIFNKGTDLECLFFFRKGSTKTSSSLKSIPNESETIDYVLDVGDQLIIQYKTTDSNWYFITKNHKHSGWIQAKYIELVNP